MDERYGGPRAPPRWLARSGGSPKTRFTSLGSLMRSCRRLFEAARGSRHLLCRSWARSVPTSCPKFASANGGRFALSALNASYGAMILTVVRGSIRMSSSRLVMASARRSDGACGLFPAAGDAPSCTAVGAPPQGQRQLGRGVLRRRYAGAAVGECIGTTTRSSLRGTGSQEGGDQRPADVRAQHQRPCGIAHGDQESRRAPATSSMFARVVRAPGFTGRDYIRCCGRGTAAGRRGQTQLAILPAGHGFAPSREKELPPDRGAWDRDRAAADIGTSFAPVSDLYSGTKFSSAELTRVHSLK